MQGQSQKREQKHTTKNFDEFHNHSPLLTMVSRSLVSFCNFWCHWNYWYCMVKRKLHSWKYVWLTWKVVSQWLLIPLSTWFNSTILPVMTVFPIITNLLSPIDNFSPSLKAHSGHMGQKFITYSVSCVMSRNSRENGINSDFLIFNMLHMKYNNQTLTCKQTQRCGQGLKLK